MIWDTLDHVDMYRTPLLGSAFDWLQSQVVGGGAAPVLPEGVHRIHSDDLFVIVQDYQTKDADAALWESHRCYIDIQLMVEGEESIEVAPVSQLAPDGTYDPETDKFRYQGTGHRIVLAQGQFLLFFPWDAHRGCMHVTAPQRVRKYCIKAEV
jgi:YhcH/YjgK/YiaL family protein